MSNLRIDAGGGERFWKCFPKVWVVVLARQRGFGAMKMGALNRRFEIIKTTTYR
jgi:hypothetical protein